ncbi:MAG TPA: alpha/beta fold hydrolase, partial [Reyranella sp.]|nr:alpha/beta fold hydrolase [Reyranella sp.]
TLHPARLAILPLVGLGTSFAGIVQSAAPSLAAIGWLVGLLAALPIGHAIGRRRAVRRLEGGRMEIAGGWFMLGFAVSIFAARYALGVLFGIAPALKAMPLWIVLSGGVGGVIAGIGLGWLAGLLMRRLPVARLVAAGFLTIAAGFVAVIALSAPAPLPRLAAGDTLPGIDTWDFSKLPEVRRVAARDGAPLTYRLYPGRADRVVVLVHGSSGASISMHASAQALQAAGATVYAISLRGHGGSGWTNGDISYRDQLDDDLVDFTRAVGLADPKVHRTLIGFSSGGGFVLRIASGPQRALFDAYLAVSPFVAHDAPTMRPNAGGWASVALPRVIALSLLDAAGLPWFQGLPVVRFATAAAASDNRTPVYSFRLQVGMQLTRAWRQRLAGIDRPTAVLARRAVRCRQLRASVRGAQSAHRRVGAARPRPHGHDRRSTRHRGGRRRMAAPRQPRHGAALRLQGARGHVRGLRRRRRSVRPRDDLDRGHAGRPARPCRGAGLAR